MNENNIECYHCPTTHTHSFSEMYKVDPAHYLHREFDRGVYHTSYFQDSVADDLGITDREGRPHYQFYYLWPNMYIEGGLSQQGSGPNFMRLWPDGVHAWEGETVRYEVPGDDDIDPEVAAQLAEWNRMTSGRGHRGGRPGADRPQVRHVHLGVHAGRERAEHAPLLLPGMEGARAGISRLRAKVVEAGSGSRSGRLSIRTRVDERGGERRRRERRNTPHGRGRGPRHR